MVRKSFGLRLQRGAITEIFVGNDFLVVKFVFRAHFWMFYVFLATPV